MTLTLTTPQPYFLDNLDKWFCSAQPDWYAALKGRRRQNQQTPRMCPSFVDIFKNSYLIKMPVDLLIAYELDAGGFYRWNWEVPSEFISLDNHDLAYQMGADYDARYLNFKIGFQIRLKSDKPRKLMFLDTFYHDVTPRDYRAMAGVMPLTGINMELMVNTYVEKKSFGTQGEFLIKEGEPLCLLYFPEGKPDIIKNPCSVDDYTGKYAYTRTSYMGDYMKKIRGLFNI
jgi:hypothetical protein